MSNLLKVISYPAGFQLAGRKGTVLLVVFRYIASLVQMSQILQGLKWQWKLKLKQLNKPQRSEKH